MMEQVERFLVAAERIAFALQDIADNMKGGVTVTTATATFEEVSISELVSEGQPIPEGEPTGLAYGHDRDTSGTEAIDRDGIKKALSAYGEFNGRVKTPTLAAALELCQQGIACPICIGTGTQVQGGKCTACGGKGMLADCDTPEPTEQLSADKKPVETPANMDLDTIKEALMKVNMTKGFDTMMGIVKEQGQADSLLSADPSTYVAMFEKAAEVLNG